MGRFKKIIIVMEFSIALGLPLVREIIVLYFSLHFWVLQVMKHILYNMENSEILR
jgi:hypothetical protein